MQLLTQNQSTSAPEVDVQPGKTLEDVLLLITTDSQDNPEQYKDEIVVPHGGE